MKINKLNRYLVVDFESPADNHICSVGFVLVENGRVVQEFSSLINPRCEFNYRTVKIHGITPKMVRHQPIFPEVWEQIKEFFTDTVIVAHNAIGDIRKLEFCLKRYHLPMPEFFYVCTERLAHKYLPEAEHFSLGGLCESLGIVAEDAHEALADARSCHRLFEHLSGYVTDFAEEISLFGSEKALRYVQKTEESPASRYAKLVLLPNYRMSRHEVAVKGGFCCEIRCRGEILAKSMAARKITARQNACREALAKIEADISAKIGVVLHLCK